MKDIYIRDLEKFDNQTITTRFVVAAKQIKPKKSGEPYLALTLSDRTGQIDAKMWDNVKEKMGVFDVDDVIEVRGLVNRYNGRLQFTIYQLIAKLDGAKIDFADFLPACDKDVDALWATLGEFVASFKNLHLKALVEAFMSDPEIAHAYRTAPAAKTLHHAYIGGLLDHVVSLCKLCDLTCRNYPQIDRDLLLTGAFLHDIGKIHELSYARAFSYTTRGQLLGHMIIELEMLQEKLRLVLGFPDDLKMLLEHMIISHHGEYEFGSPKLPMFPEALLLHYLDDLDSKMESMRAQIAVQSDPEAVWAGYNPSLARPLLNAHRLLDQSEKKVAAAAASGDGESE
jgi:3'-5' exoribonuclease